MKEEIEVAYFPTPDAFRKWLKEHGETDSELWVGYYKKKTGIPSMTWQESVDEALCYGWIDGLRKTVDEERYRIRFTPRRASSNWSAVNIKRVEALTKLGRMQPAGLTIFKNRKTSNANEQDRDKVRLTVAYEEAFKKNTVAWEFFQGLAPSYKRMSIWWVMSAKREDTRLRRLDVLIESSSKQEKIPPLQH